MSRVSGSASVPDLSTPRSLWCQPDNWAYDPIVRSSRGRRREASRLTGADAVPAGFVSQTRLPGGDGAPLAGTRTCRQELADRRGWSTFSEAWPVHRATTPPWRAERRPCFSREEYGLRKSVAPHRRATPSALSGDRKEGRLTRGRSNNTGDCACVARSGQARSAQAV